MLKNQKDRPYYIVWEDGKCHAIEPSYTTYRYDLHFATGNTIQLADDEAGRLMSQYYFYDSFFVDLIQVDSLVPFRFNLRVPQRFLYLFFMLEGECSYGRISEGDSIYSFADIFQVGYLAAGKYEVVCQPGANVGLILIVDMEWLLRMSVSYGHIQQVLARYNASNSQSEVLCHLEVDKQVKGWLRKIYMYSKRNMGAIDGNLRKYVSYILEHYDSLLAQQLDLAEQVKLYLDEEFLNKDLSMGYLASRFYTTKRTLYNHFRRRYRMTIPV